MTEQRAAERSFGLEVGKGVVAKLIQAVLGFAGTIIFARILGPTDFGGYYLLLSLVGLSRRPIAGFSGATRKRFAESESPRRELLGAQTLFNAGYIALSGIVAILVHDILQSYTGITDAALLFILVLGSLVMFAPYQGFLTSIGRFGTQTWIDTIRSVATFGFQLLLVLAGLAAAGMAYGLTLATLLMLPFTHWYLRTWPAMPTVETVRTVWSFAKYSIPATFVGEAYDRFDILLLGFLASPAAAGHYEVAYKLTVPATFIAGITSSGILARTSDMLSRDESIREDVTNALAFSSSLAIPLFFGALAIPTAVVVTAYGPEYREAAWLLVGLSLYRVFHTQNSVLTGLMSGLDRPDVELRVSTTALFLNVILGVALYLQFGPLGVVFATVVAESMRYLVFRKIAASEIGTKLIPRALQEQVGAGIIMFAIVELATSAIPIRSWMELLTVVGLGATIYFVVLTAVSHHFRITISSIAGQAISEYL